MIRHISMFFLKEDDKELRIKKAEDLVFLLKKLPDEIPEITQCTVGMNLTVPPQILSEGAPLFGDVVQIIDFAEPEAVYHYPVHPAHLRLIELTDEWIEQVTAIDFVL